MREQDDRPGGTVRLKVMGRSWKDDSSGSPTIRGILPQDQRGPCTLKASREHSVTRLMSARLESRGPTLVPSQRVARRSDRPKLLRCRRPRYGTSGSYLLPEPSDPSDSTAFRIGSPHGLNAIRLYFSRADRARSRIAALTAGVRRCQFRTSSARAKSVRPISDQGQGVVPQVVCIQRLDLRNPDCGCNSRRPLGPGLAGRRFSLVRQDGGRTQTISFTLA